VPEKDQHFLARGKDVDADEEDGDRQGDERAMSGSPMRALTGSTMKKNHPAAAISRTKSARQDIRTLDL